MNHTHRIRLVVCVALLGLCAGGCAVPTADATATSDQEHPVDLQRFTSDTTGAAQAEESVSTCATDPRLVLGASDDGRGQTDPSRGIVSWALSTNGHTLAKDGPFPTVHAAGKTIPTSADPVTAIGPEPACALYGAALAFTDEPTNPGFTSTIAAFYTPRTTLTGSCEGTTCWPVAKPVAVAPAGRFYDKDWMTVGTSGSAGTVAWSSGSTAPPPTPPAASP